MVLSLDLCLHFPEVHELAILVLERLGLVHDGRVIGL